MKTKEIGKKTQEQEVYNFKLNERETMKYVALFCRDDSDYKKLDQWDVYDKQRGALNFTEELYDGYGKITGRPFVAHPPCRLWGKLAHMACRNPDISGKMKQEEKALALWSIIRARHLGGIVEHPSSSKLWDKLVPIGKVDRWGGYVIEIDQYDFGHVAHKMTKLYIVGCPLDKLPKLPEKDNTIHLCEKGKRRSICGNVEGTTRCTQKQREYTPHNLIKWFEKTLDQIHLWNEHMGLISDQSFSRTFAFSQSNTEEYDESEILNKWFHPIWETAVGEECK
jgi:hypothetical protein